MLSYQSCSSLPRMMFLKTQRKPIARQVATCRTLGRHSLSVLCHVVCTGGTRGRGAGTHRVPLPHPMRVVCLSQAPGPLPGGPLGLRSGAQQTPGPLGGRREYAGDRGVVRGEPGTAQGQRLRLPGFGPTQPFVQSPLSWRPSSAMTRRPPWSPMALPSLTKRTGRTRPRAHRRTTWRR